MPVVAKPQGWAPGMVPKSAAEVAGGVPHYPNLPPAARHSVVPYEGDAVVTVAPKPRASLVDQVRSAQDG